VTHCSLVAIYWRFKGTSIFKVEGAYFYGISLPSFHETLPFHTASAVKEASFFFTENSVNYICVGGGLSGQ
jgi:hypothetical protein